MNGDIILEDVRTMGEQTVLVNASNVLDVSPHARVSLTYVYRRMASVLPGKAGSFLPICSTF